MKPVLSFRGIQLTLVVLVLALGIFARAKDLAWHFSHIDDVGVATSILVSRKMDLSPFWAVPRKWTYAPLQYLLPPLLISSDQSYRELLFWGRLPSCIFSILAMVALAVFYRVYLRTQPERLLLPLSLFAASWENIIFAKQMSNYAIGLLGMVMLLLLFVKNLDRPRLSWRWVIFNSGVLALVSATQYSLIFFVPAFFLVLLIADVRAGWGRWHDVLIKYATSGTLYGILIFPLWFFFLRNWSDSGITDWGMGPVREFFYQSPAGADFGQHLFYTARFYLINAVYVFQSQTGFFPEDSFYALPVSLMLLTFFVLGMVSFFCRAPMAPVDGTRLKSRYLGLFFIGMMLTWGGLVFVNKLSLSPTRHALVFLPMMVITIGEGFFWLVEQVSKIGSHVRSLARWTPAALTGIFLMIFMVNFPVFLRERRDVMVEEKIDEVLRAHDVDLVLPVEWTQQIWQMPVITRTFRPPIVGWTRFGILFPESIRPYHRIAWISHRMPLNPQTFLQVQTAINSHLRYLNRLRSQTGRTNYPFLTDPYARYRIRHMEEINNDTELEYSRRTRNGSNSLYFYVLERQ